MYAVKKLKSGKTVGIAQTGAGWNVSTYTILPQSQGQRTKIKYHADKNVSTLAEAKREFTRQKRIEQPVRRKVPVRRKRALSPMDIMMGRY